MKKIRKKPRPLTRLANFIKSWKWRWLSNFLGIVQEDILVPAFKVVGKIGLQFIMATIREQAALGEIGGRQKAANVANAFRSNFTSEKIADSTLDAIIAITYDKLKVFDKEDI